MHGHVDLNHIVIFTISYFSCGVSRRTVDFAGLFLGDLLREDWQPRFEALLAGALYTSHLHADRMSPQLELKKKAGQTGKEPTTNLAFLPHPCE